MVARRAVVLVAVGGVARVAARSPDEIDQLAVDRDQQRAGGAAQRRRCRGVAGAEGGGELDADRVDAGLLEEHVQPWLVRALGSQKPPPQPSPKRARWLCT